MWTVFKVFIEFVTLLLLFYVLVFWLRDMWDLSSPTRGRTRTPCIGRQRLNHWTAREVPPHGLFLFCFVLMIKLAEAGNALGRGSEHTVNTQ